MAVTPVQLAKRAFVRVLLAFAAHVYFLGGALYVNILFASPADVHGFFLPLQPSLGMQPCPIAP